MTFKPSVVRDATVDWVKFDAELARDGTVDPVDKALYAALASFVPAGPGSDRATAGDAEAVDAPTRRVLAACIGRSVDTVDRATKRLEERGLLAVERRRDPDNPRSNIPSVYRLLDHEQWDIRAGERAQKRKAQREADAAARKARAAQRKTPADGGWPHGCGEGGRTDAATPGRMGAAVPLLYEKTSLSEKAGNASAQVGTAVTEERETLAPPNNDTPTQVANAWTTARGTRRNPLSEGKIRTAAAELLAAGWPAEDVVALAEDMARTHPTWTDLGQHATHWQPPQPTAASAAGPSVSPWCGECNDGDEEAADDPTLRLVQDAQGRYARCHCHPHAAASARSAA